MTLSRWVDRALVLSALGLGGYLAATGDAPTHAEIEARKNNVLSTFVPEQVTRLSWTAPDGTPVTLQRGVSTSEVDDFFLGESRERKADAAVVRELISALDFSTWAREIGGPEKVSTSSFGFDDPQLEMRVDAGAREYRLLFGREAPSPAKTVYLRISGTNVESRVGVVDREMLGKLARTTQEFLGGLVLPHGKSETKSLVLKRPNNSLELTARSGGFVVQHEGKSRLADRGLLDLVFFQLARTKVDNYLKEARFTPQVTVNQQSTTGIYEVELGGSCPGDTKQQIIARRLKPEPLLGCVPRSILTALSVSPEAMSSRTGTAMNADEIDHVLIQGQKKSLDIIRSGQDYKLLSRKSELISRANGDELFKGYGQSKLTLLQSAPSSTEKVATVTLKGQVPKTAVSPSGSGDKDQVHQETLTVHQSGERLFVLRELDQAWLEVPAPHQWLYSPHDEWARETKISTWTSQDVTSVTVKTANSFEQTVTRKENGFVLQGEPSVPADPLLARELFHELGNLSADRFLSPPRPRPEAPLLEVQFNVRQSGKTTQHKLWLGERIRGGYVAWTTATDGTFVFPTLSQTVFDTPLSDRRPIQIDVDRQQRIEINLEGRLFLFERQAGALRGVGGEATDDMAEPLNRAFRAIQVISAAAQHPDAKRLRRGKSFLTIRTREMGGDQDLVLHFGEPLVWRQVSARIAWIEGQTENYFISDASLSELRELL